VPRLPPGWQERRIVLDPGHGAPGNLGNTNTDCRREGDEMWRVAAQLLANLDRPGAFDVRSSRPGGRIVDYGTRIAAADAWPAEALISLHSDARAGSHWHLDPETGCPRTQGAHGFTILWSDEGEPALVAARKRLAEVVAARMIEAGFPAYDGTDYVGLYAGDDAHPGVFVDRHQPDQRIRMLRRPLVPSIIVETHQALDPDEVARWDAPDTVDRFGLALRAALVDFFTPP
jgi:N-acetylmuramoyl-L-alanine amidase